MATLRIALSPTQFTPAAKSPTAIAAPHLSAIPERSGMADSFFALTVFFCPKGARHCSIPCQSLAPARLFDILEITIQ